MKIANEEVFGPVLSVVNWSDEYTLLDQVYRVGYGLTAAIFTKNLARAHHAAGRLQSGFIWVNNADPYFLDAGYGGYKRSGTGREESIERLLSFTQSKNINITL